MNQGYKANRPTTRQIENNYIRGQVKALTNKYERWERVNQKQIAKGLEPKYTEEHFQALSRQIQDLKEKIYE
jgi:polyhydroxyalkanoate synthesis regulator phasin